MEVAGASAAAVIILVVIVVVEIVLMSVALVDLYRRPAPRITGGGKLIWLLVIVLLGIIGPIAYFAAGRKGIDVPEDQDASRPAIADRRAVDAAATGSAPADGTPPAGDRARRAAEVLYGPGPDDPGEP